MSIYDLSLNDFLAAAASKEPTPGGGSISAVVGAHGAAMVCMVANLTIGKKKYAEFETQAKGILTRAEKVLSDLKDLTPKDMQAFEGVMRAWRLQAESEEEKTLKEIEMEKATRYATEIPLSICEACLEVVRLAHELAPFGNSTAISDVGVAAHLGAAALESSMLSVDINLPALKDETFRAQAEGRKEALLTQAQTLRAECLSTVKERM